ncbi:hypothetical protein TBLA_0H01210 [Henningerozyma blattae CBS 6284]|uniref:ENTH domain-containing protein n=1 Tax=Henningerozyma blattae (strain ATCC 34711 / CBS 6284 / DSM 70876 / NBRC 10599 / NRRL Y-10934 / UCD 77-7) TaxID=1071380 RepID=I2H7Q7_HENB6|nr:hypothetical protein TBLA_0H01210 [Tetrapisispora blattae CBS 6284]CCH62409.1 hypothetical protein TBLA_0H01210 [Tetrapisispora blattae CBS 6284]
MSKFSKKIQNLGIHDIRNAARYAQNMIIAYEPYQIDIRQATNTDSWGPTKKHLDQILLDRNKVPLRKIVDYIMKRLMDHINTRPRNLYDRARKDYVNYGTEWRVVFKSLIVLKFLLLNVDPGEQLDDLVEYLLNHYGFFKHDILEIYQVQNSSDGKDSKHQEVIQLKCQEIIELINDEKLLLQKHDANKAQLERMRIGGSIGNNLVVNKKNKQLQLQDNWDWSSENEETSIGGGELNENILDIEGVAKSPPNMLPETTNINLNLNSNSNSHTPVVQCDDDSDPDYSFKDVEDDKAATPLPTYLEHHEAAGLEDNPWRPRGMSLGRSRHQSMVSEIRRQRRETLRDSIVQTEKQRRELEHEREVSTPNPVTMESLSSPFSGNPSNNSPTAPAATSFDSTPDLLDWSTPSSPVHPSANQNTTTQTPKDTQASEFGAFETTPALQTPQTANTTTIMTPATSIVTSAKSSTAPTTTTAPTIDAFQALFQSSKGCT